MVLCENFTLFIILNYPSKKGNEMGIYILCKGKKNTLWIDFFAPLISGILGNGKGDKKIYDVNCEYLPINQRKKLKIEIEICELGFSNGIS